ncbi:MAG: hypothetical protein WB699_08830 [Bacteroidota bacterium]
MKKVGYWLFVVIVAGSLCQAVATAGSILGTTGKVCFQKGSDSGTLFVYGDWIETIDRATTSAPGVAITIQDKQNGAQHQVDPFKGRGMVKLGLSISNATPGSKQIQLSGGVFGSATVTITIEDVPTVSNIDIPVPTEPFGDITITFTGTGLQNAQDPAFGQIVHDNLVPFITVGGDASVTSVRVLNSSNTTLRAKIFFSGLVQDVSVDLRFKAIQPCNPLFAGAGGLERRVRVHSSNVKNYVTSITFPNGSAFAKNSIATININLLFPAPGGASTSTSTASLKFNPAINVGNITGSALTRNQLIAQLAQQALDNSRVFIRLVPSNAFESVPGGTQLNPNGFTELRANPGEDIIPITFKVIDCLGGQPGQTNTVKIQTWMHSTNSNLPPNFIEHTFGVTCTQ